ncbi:hypothetical protein [Actinoallomurus iriomotensis]|uniref:Uncharacterized protein n=1 Tax=Actinoallomurus iriomotensis TaxID=478107 RepID=A0A9W6RJX5_9ACTN|nr:hypothetical protein [Actinoallomurus iriomotensis]GLY76260.1 hypothetical protein Airi01_045270 [Actinoallomurus iriomotensis]
MVVSEAAALITARIGSRPHEARPAYGNTVRRAGDARLAGTDVAGGLAGHSGVVAHMFHGTPVDTDGAFRL